MPHNGAPSFRGHKTIQKGYQRAKRRVIPWMRQVATALGAPATERAGGWVAPHVSRAARSQRLGGGGPNPKGKWVPKDCHTSGSQKPKIVNPVVVGVSLQRKVSRKECLKRHTQRFSESPAAKTQSTVALLQEIMSPPREQQLQWCRIQPSTRNGKRLKHKKLDGAKWQKLVWLRKTWSRIHIYIYI